MQNDHVIFHVKGISRHIAYSGNGPHCILKILIEEEKISRLKFLMINRLIIRSNPQP